MKNKFLILILLLAAVVFLPYLSPGRAGEPEPASAVQNRWREIRECVNYWQKSLVEIDANAICQVDLLVLNSIIEGATFEKAAAARQKRAIIESKQPFKPKKLYYWSSTKIFRWTPTADQVGIHYVTFTATDPNGASASQTIKITVLPRK